MLGEGSFAKVMLARHKRSGKLAAVKIIDKTKIPATMKPYVVREPRVLPALHHKNVVKLLLTDEDDEHIYMFMQYMAGGDLHNYVEAKEWLDEREARRVFSQILDAVEYCHQVLSPFLSVPSHLLCLCKRLSKACFSYRIGSVTAISNLRTCWCPKTARESCLLTLDSLE